VIRAQTGHKQGTDRAQTGHRNIEHIYLRFFTQILRSMEKNCESSYVHVNLLNKKYKYII